MEFALNLIVFQIGIRTDKELLLTLSCRHHRKVSRNRMFSFRGKYYFVEELNGAGEWRLRNHGVTIHECHDGQTIVLANGYHLTVREVGDARPDPTPPVGSKELNDAVDRTIQVKKLRKKYIPPKEHPFKQASYQARIARLPHHV